MKFLICIMNTVGREIEYARIRSHFFTLISLIGSPEHPHHFFKGVGMRRSIRVSAFVMINPQPKEISFMRMLTRRHVSWFIVLLLICTGICFAQTAPIKVILTSGSSWSAITNGGNITVECIGGGGGGGEYYSSPASTGGGGGGGEYRKSSVAYTSGSSVSYSIGVGGTGELISPSQSLNIVSTNGGATSWNNGQVLANGGTERRGWRKWLWWKRGNRPDRVQWRQWCPSERLFQ